jgi:hypothetical protein
MRRAVSVAVGIFWLFAAGRAGAQEFSPPWPPPRVPPPPWLTLAPAHVRALELSGLHKKRVGAILIGAGSTIGAVGTGLTIAGWAEGDRCDGRDDHDRCHNSALVIAGATTTAVGLGAVIPGIVVYVRGGSELDRARNLRLWGRGPLSIEPTFNRGGAGLQFVIFH